MQTLHKSDCNYSLWIALLARQKLRGAELVSAHWERTGSVDIGSAVLSAEVMAEDFVKRREKKRTTGII